MQATIDDELAQYAYQLDELRSFLMGQATSRSSILHGPGHWGRVEQHARAICGHMRIPLVVPVLFAMVHDSQRIDDGADVWHGERAARFVRGQRGRQFGFLSAEQLELLVEACAHHSNGQVSTNPIIAACWDADRLDLWRIGRRPNLDLLSTAFAKQPAAINFAEALACDQELRPQPQDEFHHGVT